MQRNLLLSKSVQCARTVSAARAQGCSMRLSFTLHLLTRSQVGHLLNCRFHYANNKLIPQGCSYTLFQDASHTLKDINSFQYHTQKSAITAMVQLLLFRKLHILVLSSTTKHQNSQYHHIVHIYGPSQQIRVRFPVLYHLRSSEQI